MAKSRLASAGWTLIASPLAPGRSCRLMSTSVALCDPMTAAAVAIRTPLSQTSALDVTPASRSVVCGASPSTVIVSRYHHGTWNCARSTFCRLVEWHRSAGSFRFSISPAITVDRRLTRYQPAGSKPGREITSPPEVATADDWMCQPVTGLATPMPAVITVDPVVRWAAGRGGEPHAVEPRTRSAVTAAAALICRRMGWRLEHRVSRFALLLPHRTLPVNPVEGCGQTVENGAGICSRPGRRVMG